MTRRGEAIAVASAMTVVVTTALVSSASLGPAARRMPLVIGLPTLALLAAALARLIHARDGTGSDGVERAREASAFRWIAALLGLVLLVGMSAGVPAFVLAYVRWESRERWAAAIGMATALAVLLAGGLEFALGLRLYPGVAGSWLMERLG